VKCVEEAVIPTATCDKKGEREEGRKANRKRVAIPTTAR
jgi:hypothetical protein